MAELAASQNGVVSIQQLTALSVSSSMVHHRVERGRLRRVHLGVYAVGLSPLSRQGRFMAAVLACGPGAVLSHRSAGVLWALVAGGGGPIHVTAARQRRGDDVIRVHRSRTLGDAEITRENGIPVTTPARTLLDLAPVLDHHRLARAVHEAEVQRLFDLPAVDQAIARANGHRGTGRLRDAIEDWRDQGVTKSRLEERFLSLVARARLPRPRTNVPIDVGPRIITVDAMWPRQGLLVELDGRATHLTRQAFEDDRLRDEQLRLAGFTPPLRFTWRRLRDDPASVTDTLGAFLR